MGCPTSMLHRGTRRRLLFGKSTRVDVDLKGVTVMNGKSDDSAPRAFRRACLYLLALALIPFGPGAGR